MNVTLLIVIAVLSMLGGASLEFYQQRRNARWTEVIHCGDTNCEDDHG